MRRKLKKKKCVCVLYGNFTPIARAYLLLRGLYIKLDGTFATCHKKSIIKKRPPSHLHITCVCNSTKEMWWGCSYVIFPYFLFKPLYFCCVYIMFQISFSFSFFLKRKEQKPLLCFFKKKFKKNKNILSWVFFIKCLCFFNA